MKQVALELLKHVNETQILGQDSFEIINKDATEVLDKIDEVVKGTETCQEVDILQLEDQAQGILENVQDLMVNIDLSSSQYNLSDLYTEAQKLGMDMADLTEYGFDERAMKCAGKSCRTIDQKFDQMIMQQSAVNRKAMLLMLETYQKASCHPLM